TRQKQKVMKYNVMNKETGEIFSDKMEIVNIDLVSFYELCYTNSTLDNLSDFEKIMGLLGCKTKEEEKLFEHEKGIIEKIMKKAEKFRDDSEMIEMYDRDKVIASMYEKDKKESIKKAVELAVSETTKKVSKKEKQDIARNMFRENINIDIIFKVTGLTIEEINELKKEL
ncbi:MAG: PD-(D/E)XK nuclease family transposase, partial [Bacilli bacterium]|nr:PD-(D/E)XK nuclease family transposase [Bacilli bacterium]